MLYSTMLKWVMIFIVGSLMTVSSNNSVGTKNDENSSPEVQPLLKTADEPKDESNISSGSSSEATDDDSSSSTSSVEETHYPMKLQTLRCAQNETYSLCIDPCPRAQCDFNETSTKCKSPPKVGDQECIKGCRCSDSYFKTKEGRCVLKSDCPKCVGKDEIYVNCPRTCPPQTCESIWSSQPCPLQPTVCRPSCRCKPTMYRNFKGECISREDCLKCRGANEYFSCGGACDNECARMSKQNQTSCPIVTKECTKKCYCKPGFARNVHGHCIVISACPAECKENEEYVKNTKAINRPRTCSEFLLGLMPYQKDDVAIPGCTCVAGYVKNHKDICIPQKECYSDVVHGDLIDANLTEVIAITTLTILVPTPPLCGPNEVMSNCINSGCQKHECSQLGRLDNCVYIPPRLCKKGCQCKEGYLRDVGGKCIPIADCPQKACNGTNEMLAECPNTCITESCYPMPSKIYCPRPRVCIPSCRCKPNTCRNGKDECVSREKPCKDNERYVHNVNAHAGPKTCRDARLPDADTKNISIPQKRYMVRRSGCICIDGYVKNDDDVCIPVKDCPPPCGLNEVYVNDTNRVCRPLECSGIGYKINCKSNDDQSGTEATVPGCICREGHVRDVRDNCILKSRCPSCGGDPNATGGCGVFCKTCDTYKNGPRICPRICFPNGCQCKPGYVYDTNRSKCVLPEACDENQIPSITSDAIDSQIIT